MSDKAPTTTDYFAIYAIGLEDRRPITIHRYEEACTPIVSLFATMKVKCEVRKLTLPNDFIERKD